MPTPRPRRSPVKVPAGHSLMVRLDDDSNACLVQAATLRGISLSDYVRTVTVPEARREVLAAREQTLAMTARAPSPAPPRLRRAPVLAATAPEGHARWLIPRSFRSSGRFPPQLRL